MLQFIPRQCLMRLPCAAKASKSFQNNASIHSKTMPHAAILHRQGIKVIPRQCFNSFQDNASCGYHAPPRHQSHAKTCTSFLDNASIHSKRILQFIPRQCLMLQSIPRQCFNSFQDNASCGHFAPPGLVNPLEDHALLDSKTLLPSIP